MSLKTCYLLFSIFFVTLSALLIIDNAIAVRDFIFSRLTLIALIGALGVVAHFMEKSKNKKVVGLGICLTLVTMFLCIWQAFELTFEPTMDFISEFLN